MPRFQTAISAICLLVGITMPASSEPATHKFGLWGLKGQSKISLYVGFTNGLFNARTGEYKPLYECLQKILYDDAVDLIDRYYKDNPDKREDDFASQVLAALTAKGTPCQGMAP